MTDTSDPNEMRSVQHAPTLLHRDVVPRNAGGSWTVLRGQRIRIIGRTVIDFVAFNLHDLTERFDQARTKTNQAKLFITSGDRLYSKRNNVMLTIVEDGFPEGRHDLQKGMCSRDRFRLVLEGKAQRLFADGSDLNPRTAADVPDHGCWENLIAALHGWGIADVDIPSPFNIFQTMEVEPDTGRLLDSTLRPVRPTNVDLRAEMDCVVAISTCPQSGRGEAATVEIYAS